MVVHVLGGRHTLASKRATVSGLHRSGKNWYSLSKALLASKSYVPDFTLKDTRVKFEVERASTVSDTAVVVKSRFSAVTCRLQEDWMPGARKHGTQK